MDKKTLDMINTFTRRPLTEEEVYVFPVILCDNEVDRDGERFSDEALEKLCRLFVGRTGIFDHKPDAGNQNARIFHTELVSDPERITKAGEPYKYLKAQAYMVRTDENRNLIAEIDGGIKKEVSISCTAAERKCSVCGGESCAHIRGKYYGGKLCHTVLGGITDAYEWSFVAVPAQVNAGVTKRFSEETETHSPSAETLAVNEELRREIRRLAYFTGGRTASAAAALAAGMLGTDELAKLKKSYEKLAGNGGVVLELAPGENSPESDESGQFRVR